MKAVAYVGRVTDVQPHPDNATLNTKMDVVTISGHTNVATRVGPDQPRYKVGDFAVLLTENMILPKRLMKALGLWNDEKNEGMLGGKNKDRLRPRSIGITNKIKSEVALYPCKWEPQADQKSGVIVLSDWDREDWPNTPHVVVTATDDGALSPEGIDVAANLGIKEIFES